MTETEVFRMGHGRFALKMASLYGKPWIAVCATLAIGFALVGIFHDLRWAVLSLMTVFLITPMALAFLYIYHGMRPMSALNVADHRISIGPDFLLATVYAKEEGTEDGETVYRPLTERALPYSALGRWQVGLDSVTIPLTGEEKGFLWLPAEAFGGDSSLAAAMTELAQRTRRQNATN